MLDSWRTAELISDSWDTIPILEEEVERANNNLPPVPRSKGKVPKYAGVEALLAEIIAELIPLAKQNPQDIRCNGKFKVSLCF